MRGEGGIFSDENRGNEILSLDWPTETLRRAYNSIFEFVLEFRSCFTIRHKQKTRIRVLK